MKRMCALQLIIKSNINLEQALDVNPTFSGPEITLCRSLAELDLFIPRPVVRVQTNEVAERQQVQKTTNAETITEWKIENINGKAS